jgi:hypothetical protein
MLLYALAVVLIVCIELTALASVLDEAVALPFLRGWRQHIQPAPRPVVFLAPLLAIAALSLGTHAAPNWLRLSTLIESCLFATAYALWYWTQRHGA